MMVPSFLSPRQPGNHVTGIPSFPHWISFFCMLALTAGLLGMLPSTATAQAGLVVTSVADTGAGSLRQAILDAPVGATITFSLPNPSVITLTSQITVDKDLTITGPGQAALAISGGGTNRIFLVTAGTLRLSGMTLRNGTMRGQNAANMNPGTYSGLGGAIYISGGAGVTATQVTFANNAAYGGTGGNAVFSAGFYGGGGGGLGGAPTIDGGFGGGGGGGYATYAAGTGGFGGGGGGNTGSGGPIGSAGYGGVGGSGAAGQAGYGGGGGGGGLGGAVFIQAGGALGLQDVAFTNNTATGGAGGNNTSGFGGGGGGGGAGLGSAVFNDGDLCARTGVTYTGNTTVAGAAGAGACGFGGGACPTAATAGSALDTTPGVFDHSGSHACAVWSSAPTSLSFAPVVLEENRPAGTAAGSFSATDPDAGDTFTYSLVSGAGSEHNASFSISGSQLLTAAPLDFETRAVYNIRVRVTDSYGRYREETFSVTIQNANDAPSALTLSSSSIQEDLPAGTNVGLFSAVDQDHSTHTFTLVDPGGACSGADNGAFQISGDMLRSNQVFDYETRSAYTICVRAADSGSPVGTFDQQFTINIQNANEQPTAIHLSATVAQENLPAGTLVGTLSTSDPDTAQTHTYELLYASPDCPTPDLGLFTISGDQLLTALPLDYEDQPSLNVCVRSTDDGDPALSIDRPFTVTVTDANDAPTDIDLSNDSLAENLPAGQLVGLLSTTDQDSGQTHAYSFADLGAGCSGGDNSLFAIDGAELRSASVFDYETRSSYDVCIQTSDNGSPAATHARPFTIRVTDVNDPPTGVALSSTSLTENQPAGTLIGTLTATDVDNPPHTFSLVSGGAGCDGADNGAFEISGDTLRSGQVFDYETRSAYSICVRAADSGSPVGTFDQQFTVSIEDGNEQPTAIDLSASSVAENQPAGTLVGTLSTSDPDSGQTHTYQLLDASPDCPTVDPGVFAISGDQLLTAQPLDYEAHPTLTACVRSTDNGDPALSVDRPFTVTVTDANDIPSMISLSNDSVAENLPAGQLIGLLSTTDQDAGQTHAYSFADLGPGCSGADNSLFAIDGAELRSTETFDYETRSSYSVCIQTSDDGTPVERFARAFTIRVTDVNDLPTGVALSSTNLPENQPVGALVGTLSATDQDNPPHSFTLVSGGAGCDGADNSAFSISGSQLLSAAVFNYEDRASYTICVRAADSGSPVGTFDQPFTLTIDNVNEAPLVAAPIPDQTVEAGTAYAYAFPAGTFTDPDGETLAYTAALSDDSPLPAWLSFDPAARALSGTPLEVQSLDIRVTATDPGALFVSDTFRLDVLEQPGNHAPVVLAGIPNALAHVDAPFTHTFAADAFADYDGDPLTYQAVLDGGAPLPAWLSFDAAARTFSGTPGAGDIATLTLRVTALDGRGGRASTLFQIGVDSYVLPWLAQPIPDQAIRLGRPWSFQIPAGTFGHASEVPLLYMVSQADLTPLPAWLSFNPDTRTFSGMPPADAGQMTWQLRVEVFDGPPGMGATDTFAISPWSGSGASLPPGSLLAFVDQIGAGPAADIKNATRLNRTTLPQASYGGDPLTDWSPAGMQVCYSVGASESLRAGGNLRRLAIGAADADGWTLISTRLAGSGTICATAPAAAWFDVFLLPAPAQAEGADSAAALPATGFAPGRVTALAPQPQRLAYADLGDVWLEIPALQVKTAITGVPLDNGAWDVSWLGGSAGWLEGSAFPGLDGNSVLTGHIFDAQGKPGPFNSLRGMAWGQQIIVHAFGVAYTYEVRSVESFVSPRNTQVLQHEDRPWLTLITCQGYDEASGSYRWRSVVRAVLVRTQSAP